MMTLIDDREHWTSLVRAAQQGDATAWPAIIKRFEDLAVASAVGLCGDLDEAPDIAQEAFVLAFRHVASLHDPAAFPAWLLRLVRTATNSRSRRRRAATVSLDAANVRAAVERLPEGERCVVALHYLAGMPYAEVAAFLDISVSAAKKRAWSARTRLKELLPMVADALVAARPSDSEAFTDTILLFQAIRVHDVDGLAHLLARNPSLATATEDWSPTEGFESRLGFSEGHDLAARRLAAGADPLVDDRLRTRPLRTGGVRTGDSQQRPPATIDLIGPGDPAYRRRRFDASLERLVASPGPKVVTCVPAPMP